LKRVYLITASWLLFSCIGLSWSVPAKNSDPEKAHIGAGISDHSTTNIEAEADCIYTELSLEKQGLSKKAFEYAYKGYSRLLKKQLIKEPGYLTICDFSQSSHKKRLYLVDLANNKLKLNTYVAHGRNSGGEFATRFSNKSSSLQSSLGFYITQETYFGEHGLSLRIDGLEKGYNDKAIRRGIVIHGADYIEDNWLKKSRCMGRSYGCPAIPAKERDLIINIIKNGTCLFIYHPSGNYLKGSKILND
jgi:L,D-transpeptidase catalytic domain